MDTHIKERLVGAIVLILTMVAVVPVFLDGQDILTTEKSLISDNQKKDKDRQIITLNLDRNTPIPINDNRNESIYIKKFNNLFNQSRNKIKVINL
jgi:cell division septation protein DedD